MLTQFLISRCQRALVFAFALLLLSSGSTPGHAAPGVKTRFRTANYTTGQYWESAEDLKVKTLGGFLRVQRVWEKDGWTFNTSLGNLAFECEIEFTNPGVYGAASPGEQTGGSGGTTSAVTCEETTDGSGETPTKKLKTLSRGSVKYEAAEAGDSLFRASNDATILRLEDGFRWTGRNGRWVLYDETGRATSFGYPSGVSHTVVRDAEGRVGGLTDHHGTTVLFYDYDAEGRVWRARDYTGREVVYGYDAQSRLETVTDVLGYVWTYTYSGKYLTAVIDPEGRRTSISISSKGVFNAESEETGIGASYKRSYNKEKQEFYLQIKHSGNRVDERWFTREGRLKRKDLNGRTVYLLRKDTDHETIVDENGNSTIVVRDSLNQIKSITYPDSSRVSINETGATSGGIVLSNSSGSLGLLDRPRLVVNENDVTTKYSYDGFGNLEEIREAYQTAEERVTTLGYDAYGQPERLTQVVDGTALDRTIRATYDAYGNRRTFTDAEGNLIQFDDYDVLGNPRTITDGRGKIWKFLYDAAGNLKEEETPLQEKKVYTYDKAGNRTGFTDEELQTTIYAYDLSSRLETITNALDATQQVTYSAGGFIDSYTDGEGHSVGYGYDRDGQLTRYTDGNEFTTGREVLYGNTDANPNPGRLERVTYPTFIRETLFDERNRPVRQTDSAQDVPDQVTTWKYDAVGNLKEETLPGNRLITRKYDLHNRLKEESYGEATTEFRRDPWGAELIVVDPRSNETKYVYDKNGQLATETRSVDKTASYQYDGNGNLKFYFGRNGQKHEYIYDDAGRLKEVHTFTTIVDATPIKTITYAYNKRGDLTGYTDGETSAVYTPDALGRLSSASVNFGAFSLTTSSTYYKNDQLKTFTGPDNKTTTFYYDGNDQVTGMLVEDHGMVGFPEYQWLAPKTQTLPGGGTRAAEYDGLLRTKDLTSTDSAGTTQQQIGYGYEDTGLIGIKTVDGTTTTYGYDTNDRLATVTGAAPGDESFTYDPAGNRSPATGSSWIYGDNNQLDTAEAATYTYDDAGNPTHKIEGDVTLTYVWDEFNQLTAIQRQQGTNPATTAATYGYDPFGRRLWKETAGLRTYFFWAGDALVAEANAAGQVLRSYGYAPEANAFAPSYMREHDLQAGTNTVYDVHSDHLQTPKLLTNKAGQVAWRADHLAYGQAAVDAASTLEFNIRFPGQYYDAESGLHYNRFRYYDPSLGRYLNQDPIGQFDHTNLYQYASNNPYVNWDPYGLMVRSISMTTVGTAFSANLPGAAVTIASSISADRVGNIGFSLTTAWGAEGPNPGASLSLNSGYYTEGSVKDLAGLGFETGGSFYSPVLLGGEVAAVADGSVQGFLDGGAGSIGSNLSGVVVDIGVGTPGWNAHVLSTETVTAGFNLFTGELFGCARECAVFDLY